MPKFPSVIDAIRAEAECISRLAIQAHMELPADDPYELIVHPDGKWELMTLDLDQAIHADPDKLDGVFAHMGRRLVRNNLEAVDALLFQLNKVRGSLHKIAALT